MHITIASIPNDNSTCRVMEWLRCYGASVDRIHSLSPSNFQVSISNSEKLSNSEKPHGLWLRRPDVAHREKPQLDAEDLTHSDDKEMITRQLEQDRRSYYKSFWDNIEAKNTIGTIYDLGPDKLRQLKLAKESGLDIPHTLITSSKKKLLTFWELCQSTGGIISKCITDGFMVKREGYFHSMFTEEIDKIEIDELPDTFGTTLFQEKLNKDYEIRTFFLKDMYYSMAIFSQKDDKTSVDFRKYNTEKPNRIAPYKLPETVEKNTKSLMYKLGLDTGSIDFVKTKCGRWVYLEVNPVGQFGMVSEPCNYFLEREIARELIKQ
ncbi:MAG: grasp-with-spasm system ATP-grasp peptide maturase [Flavobacteriales bacterium]|nr:grasp-with-spasm system ATP-grasp peptide maturase [Flavobacteriales bacterium]